jgi:tetratricopeptide (TPR) repeat protein
MTHSLKGLVYLAQKMDQQAEAEFKTAIDTYENYTQPYYELAALYMKRKALEQAIEQYNAVLKQNPDQPRAHMLLGMLFDMQQKTDLSEQHYRDALKINPQFVPAANNLAYLLAERGEDLNEALELARQAKEKMPNDPGVMDTLGWVFYKKGLYDSAIAELNDCVEKMKDNATVHYHLGMAYFKAGEGARAKEALDKVMALDPQFVKADEVREILGTL